MNFRRFSFTMLVLLILQFFSGMVVNLWVTLPQMHPGAGSGTYFQGVSEAMRWAVAAGGGSALAIHVILALLLVIGSVVFFVAALALKDRFWTIISGVAALFMLGAMFNGASFVNYGLPISSLIMAACFAVATTMYAIGLYLTKPSTRGRDLQ